MSNSSDITIRVKGDTSELVTELSEGQKRLESFVNATSSVVHELDNKWNQAAAGIAVYGTALSNVSGAIQQFIISPLSGAVNAFVEFGDKFAKTSQRVGMSVLRSLYGGKERNSGKIYGVGTVQLMFFLKYGQYFKKFQPPPCGKFTNGLYSNFVCECAFQCEYICARLKCHAKRKTELFKVYIIPLSLPSESRSKK